MNYSFEYIDIILLAMIAGFIFLRLRGILGKRTGFEGKAAPQFEEILKNIPLMQEIINKMEKESKNFNIESTPTFIINNNHKISGALSFKDFEKELLTLIKAKNS